MPRSQDKTAKDKKLKPATFIELESLNELARLACALERVPLPIFATKAESGYVLSTQLDFFVGSPVFYFARSSEAKQYLGYRTLSSAEEISFVDNPLNASLVYAPVIEILKFPKSFEQGLKGEIFSGPKYLSVQVKDLLGLVKVATYKIMFEEPPLPIFAFPLKSGKWRVGTFTRMEEQENASVFFSYEQDSRPEENFACYSSARAQASFTNRTDEHGNLFVKIIRLKGSHPLVELD